ncbi:MAG: AraC family transcriptional regulator [Pseudomonadota bacterium]
MATTHDTIQRIERAAQYMADVLAEERTPSLDEVAQHVGLSKFHFHRLYTLVTGETCQDTLTRLRLARAARALENPKTSVTDAAFEAGYGSSQSFAKAFRRHVSESASTLRADPQRLAQTVQTLTAPPAKAQGEEDPALRIELASFEPFSILAIRTEGRYPKLNATYIALFEAVGDPALVEAIVGRPWQDITASEGTALPFDCGLKVLQVPNDLPSNIARQNVGGGRFLLTRNIGTYAGLPDAVDHLYRFALADPDVRIADQPLLFHYLDDPEETPEEALRTDLYLPLDTHHLEVTP